MMIEFLLDIAPVFLFCAALVVNGLVHTINHLDFWVYFVTIEGSFLRYTKTLRQRHEVELANALTYLDRLREERREIARKLSDSHTK